MTGPGNHPRRRVRGERARPPMDPQSGVAADDLTVGHRQQAKTVTAKHRRLFVGLWPDPDTARQLARLADQAASRFGGRTMRVDTLHLTLAFLGNVDVDRTSALCRMIETWSPVGGSITLAHVGRFRGPRILWLGPTDACVPWLDALHADLCARLERLGFEVAGEPFRPHVSLLRKAGPGDVAALVVEPPVPWRPDRCVLVASTPRETGSYYEVLAECRLSTA